MSRRKQRNKTVMLWLHSRLALHGRGSLRHRLSLNTNGIIPATWGFVKQNPRWDINFSGQARITLSCLACSRRAASSFKPPAGGNEDRGLRAPSDSKHKRNRCALPGLYSSLRSIRAVRDGSGTCHALCPPRRPASLRLEGKSIRGLWPLLGFCPSLRSIRPAPGHSTLPITRTWRR